MYKKIIIFIKNIQDFGIKYVHYHNYFFKVISIKWKHLIFQHVVKKLPKHIYRYIVFNSEIMLYLYPRDF